MAPVLETTTGEIITTAPAETYAGMTADALDVHLTSVENLLVVQLIGSALMVGALIALLVVRWFHVR